MRANLLIVSIFLNILCFAQNDTIVLRGNYYGHNLYRQDPFAGSGIGYCIIKELVNGQEVKDNEISSSAFELDFTDFQLKIGDTVEVLIIYKNDCKPKVLNPEVLLPPSAFEIVSMNLDSLGVLHWTSKNETGKLTYIIDAFRWDKWVKVGEMKEKSKGQNTYSFNAKLNSGKNIFRLRQVDLKPTPRLSQTAEFISATPQVTLKDTTIEKEIIFSDTTCFEIYDKFGNIVKKGFAKKVNCLDLSDDLYFLNYDNTKGVRIKRVKQSKK